MRQQIYAYKHKNIGCQTLFETLAGVSGLDLSQALPFFKPISQRQIHVWTNEVHCN